MPLYHFKPGKDGKMGELVRVSGDAEFTPGQIQLSKPTGPKSAGAREVYGCEQCEAKFLKHGLMLEHMREEHESAS